MDCDLARWNLCGIYVEFMWNLCGIYVEFMWNLCGIYGRLRCDSRDARCLQMSPGHVPIGVTSDTSKKCAAVPHGSRWFFHLRGVARRLPFEGMAGVTRLTPQISNVCPLCTRCITWPDLSIFLNVSQCSTVLKLFKHCLSIFNPYVSATSRT